MQNTCSKTNRRTDCMQLSKLWRKRRVRMSHNETESKIKPEMTVTCGVHYRREPFSFSLHMGHCIVMGEALLVVDVPQEAPRIGTYSHFRMSRLARPRACCTCPSPTSKMPKQRTRQRGVATRHVWCHRTPKKDLVKRRIWTWSEGYKSGTMLHFSVLWKNSEKNTIHWGHC